MLPRSQLRVAAVALRIRSTATEATKANDRPAATFSPRPGTGPCRRGPPDLSPSRIGRSIVLDGAGGCERMHWHVVGWRVWLALILRRVLYGRMSISLASADWYERLSRAMRQDGWQVARIDGPSCILERSRLRVR